MLTWLIENDWRTHRQLNKETVTDRDSDWSTEKEGTDALTDRLTDRQKQWLIDKIQTVTEIDSDRDRNG